MDKPSFTQDQVFRQAHIYDSTMSSMKSVGLPTAAARHAIDEEEGYYATSKRSRDNGRNNYSGNKSRKDRQQEEDEPEMRDYHGKDYLHDWREHPTSPTAWEKNVKCKECKQRGHAIRTCPRLQPQSNEEYSNSDEEDSNSDDDSN